MRVTLLFLDVARSEWFRKRRIVFGTVQAGCYFGEILFVLAHTVELLFVCRASMRVRVQCVRACVRACVCTCVRTCVRMLACCRCALRVVCDTSAQNLLLLSRHAQADAASSSSSSSSAATGGSGAAAAAAAAAAAGTANAPKVITADSLDPVLIEACKLLPEKTFELTEEQKTYYVSLYGLLLARS